MCVLVCVRVNMGMQVAGGGAVEAALSIYLDSFATTLGTREQLAIYEFSQVRALPLPCTVHVCMYVCTCTHAIVPSVQYRCCLTVCVHPLSLDTISMYGSMRAHAYN
jgi:hypothetical protein